MGTAKVCVCVCVCVYIPIRVTATHPPPSLTGVHTTIQVKPYLGVESLNSITVVSLVVRACMDFGVSAICQICYCICPLAYSYP